MSTSPDLPPVNTAPSSLNGARQLALHLGWLVLFGGFAWALPAPWSLVPWLVYGVGLVTLFAPLHESSHNSVFAHDWANRALASVLGLILFLPALEFRYFHFAHHRHTQDPEKDPELSGGKPANMGQYLWALSGLPMWWGVARNNFSMILGRHAPAYIPAGRRAAVYRQARLYLLGYLALLVFSFAAQSAVLFWFWLLPLLLCQPFLRFVLMAEHGGCDFVPDMLRNSRTTLSSPPVRFLMWNMNYHSEHHSQPSLPFWALPAQHKRQREQVEFLSPSYPGAHREIRTQFRRPTAQP